jgi:hypothetical protein
MPDTKGTGWVSGTGAMKCLAPGGEAKRKGIVFWTMPLTLRALIAGINLVTLA